MKIAVITDSSVYLEEEYKDRDNLFILDIPIVIEGETYYEGRNLSNKEFYQKMAASSELPKTSQPSLARLEELLNDLNKNGYTHVIGLFISKGISGFYQNSFYLQNEYEDMTIKFFDTLITSAPLGYMVETVLNEAKDGLDFEQISNHIDEIIEKTRAYIVVDDLNHLVLGGRLSNGAAIVGNLLNIKPILEFDRDGEIVVLDKVRSSKKAYKRLISIIEDGTKDGDYKIFVIHSNANDLAEDMVSNLRKEGFDDISIASFGAVIGTHLGENALALAISPIVK